VAGNRGDGLSRVAIALLAARLTRALAVAVVSPLSYWLAFGLSAGVLVDRYDRRMLACCWPMGCALWPSRS
jgi:hypothetical protein